MALGKVSGILATGIWIFSGCFLIFTARVADTSIAKFLYFLDIARFLKPGALEGTRAPLAF